MTRWIAILAGIGYLVPLVGERAVPDEPRWVHRGWLYGGIEDLGEPAVTELLLDWIAPFITRVERDRMIAWHLGVSL